MSLWKGIVYGIDIIYDFVKIKSEMRYHYYGIEARFSTLEFLFKGKHIF